MNQLKNIIIVSLGVVSFGCGNDFLNLSPTNRLGEDEVVTNLQDFEYGLNGAYTYLEYNRNDQLLEADLMGDDLMEAPGKTYLDHAYQYMNTKDNAPTDMWIALYKGSYHINGILEKAAKIPEVGTTRYKEVKAEITMIRDILHFDAVVRFGPLPGTLGHGKIKADALGVKISDKLPQSLRGDFYRDKVSDVFSFIINDMESVVNDLSKKKNNAYLTYWAGKAFMARVYLYNENWTEALACAKDVIENSPFTLYNRDNYIPSWRETYGSEAIFEMPTRDDDNGGWGSLSFYSAIDGYAAIRATQDFIDLMEADTSDVRFGVLVYDEENDQYLPQNKHYGRNGNLKVSNPKVYRLSEQYLIAAEAAMKAGDPVLGGKYLSDLREQRSLKDPRKYDGGITIDDVLYERRVELFAEGHRAWDLWRNLLPVVRWTTSEEKAAKGHWSPVGYINYDDYRTIWPVRVRDIEIMKPEDQATQQNPGY